MKILEIELLDSLFSLLISEIQTIEFGKDVEVPHMNNTLKRKVKSAHGSEETDGYKRLLFICIIYKNGLSDFLSGDEETLKDIYTDIKNRLNYFR